MTERQDPADDAGPARLAVVEDAGAPDPSVPRALAQDLTAALQLTVGEGVVLQLLPLQDRALATSTAQRLLACVLLPRLVPASLLEALTLRLAEAGAGHGWMVCPVMYQPPQWRALDAVCGGRGWLASVEPGELAARRLTQLGQGARAEQARLAYLQRQLRGLRSAAEGLRHSGSWPADAAYPLLAATWCQALELLFASEGLSFTPDAGGAEVFRRRFAVGAHFSADDIARCQAAIGAAWQVRLLRASDGDTPHRGIGWEQDSGQLADFIERLERHLLAQLAPAAARQQVRRQRWAAVLAALAMLLGYGAHALVTSRPEPSRTDPRALGKPGGIVSTWFAGENFQEQKFSRVDSRIDFNSRKTLDPRLDADHFSVRWRGWIRFEKPGKQVLCFTSDDGSRVEFNGRRIIDAWKRGRPTAHCAQLSVGSDWYPLAIDYFESTGGAVAKLTTGDNPDLASVVPPQRLCCSDPPVALAAP